MDLEMKTRTMASIHLDPPLFRSAFRKFRRNSTISDEPRVENVCLHGLVDPTINLKEAMDDINNMFGKPIDYVRRKRSSKPEKAPESNSRKEVGGFEILADDDLGHQQAPPPPPRKFRGKSIVSDLFEPTLVTKGAMDDINKMFNMPLGF
ncbi:hypothetical protein L6164_029756 [Bauhinia variegata]|uniref:Uncharacterized protein n=1 Tax=Bauhinia variegata TaxID=167791 RepID=A0ACB9LAA6_BAUVA|nr:hypothetical protein L6164_029756 [Bauhinia variegata]